MRELVLYQMPKYRQKAKQKIVGLRVDMSELQKYARKWL